VNVEKNPPFRRSRQSDHESGPSGANRQSRQRRAFMARVMSMSQGSRHFESFRDEIWTEFKGHLSGHREVFSVGTARHRSQFVWQISGSRGLTGQSVSRCLAPYKRVFAESVMIAAQEAGIATSQHLFGRHLRPPISSIDCARANSPWPAPQQPIRRLWAMGFRFRALP